MTVGALATTEEDLASLESLGVPEVEEAIKAYRSITVTPEFREMERLRAKARHDEAQALYNAGRKKAVEIAKNMLQAGENTEKTIKYTGLTHAELKGLREKS